MNGKKMLDYHSDESEVVENETLDFEKLYKMQEEFQKKVQEYENLANKVKVPDDNVDVFVYHVAAMVEEMGEVLRADKRWKTHRNKRFERVEKLYELADVFITAMNMSMYSGFSSEEMYKAIESKIKINKANLELDSLQEKEGK